MFEVVLLQMYSESSHGLDRHTFDAFHSSSHIQSKLENIKDKFIFRVQVLKRLQKHNIHFFLVDHF